MSWRHDSDDETLMAAYQGGEAGAFDVLVRRHQNQIYRFLLRLTRAEQLADEALVETFYKLHRAAVSYEAKNRFKSYLFTIAHREGLMALRSQNRHDAHHGTLGHLQPAEVSTSPLSHVPTNPERALAARQGVSAVDEALRRLGERERAIFVLYYREELSTTEISQVLDIPAGSIRTYLAAARKAISAILEQDQQTTGAHAMARRPSC